MAQKKNDEAVDTAPEISDDMPVVPHKVLHIGVDFYSDEACTKKVEDASIVILEPLDPDDSVHELDIVPTTLDYEVGQYVHFKTNHHKMWDAAWFHNPQDGNVQKCWNVAAAEFVGAVLAPEVLAQNKIRIDELERRLAEKTQRTVETPRVN